MNETLESHGYIYNLVIAFEDGTMSCIPYSSMEKADANMKLVEHVYEDYSWAVITRSIIDTPLITPVEIN